MSFGPHKSRFWGSKHLHKKHIEISHGLWNLPVGLNDMISWNFNRIVISISRREFQRLLRLEVLESLQTKHLLTLPWNEQLAPEIRPGLKRIFHLSTIHISIFWCYASFREGHVLAISLLFPYHFTKDCWCNTICQQQEEEQREGGSRATRWGSF